MQEVNNEDGLQRFDRNSYLDEDQGGFQLLDLIVMEIKSHMTCYNSMPLTGWNYSIQTGEQIM